MSYKPFMGVSDSSGDGPIFVDTLSASGDGHMVENLGNSDMKNFKTGSSAMDIVNSEAVKSDFCVFHFNQPRGAHQRGCL